MPDVPLTVNFPASLDTVVSGGEVANRAFTTLSNTITDTALSIPLTDSTVFPTTGVITLTDSLTAPTKTEDIIYTANAANALTVPTGGRGAFGSTAQNWSGTVYVRMRMMAEHHEWARDAIIQLETIVGADATPLASRYATISHNHSGVYEPANANIQAHIASTSNPHSVTKSQVGLGSVENTALSTWAGSTNLTTLGTISAGTWNGAVIDEDYGGAGSINGILKANGSGTVSAAVSGTDYLSATAPGSSGQLLYNNANAYAAVSGSTVSGTGLALTGRLDLGPGDFSGFIEGSGFSFDRAFTGTLSDTNNGLYGVSVSQSIDPATVTASTPQIYAGSFAVTVPNTNSSNWHSLAGVTGYVDYVGSGTASDLYGLTFPVYHGGSGTVTRLRGVDVYLQNYGAGTVTSMYGVYAGYYPSSGAITTSYAFYANADWKHATVTNAYFAWFDSAGVWRVNGDGVVAYYNPLFTKYTPGASNYERIVTQWNSNVAEIGVEAGGTGTLRSLKLIGNALTQPAPASAIADGSIAASHLHFYQDEIADTLSVKWKESGGTVHSLTFGASGANTALSNLSAVSINASLIPQTTIDLGAQVTPWKNLWLYGGGTFGTHSIKLDGTPTGHRTITFPDATDTVAVLGTAQTFSAAQSFSNTIALTSTTAANNLITQGAAINIGTTSTDGIILQNTTAAAAGAQQYSPRLRFRGNGWKTNATAASQAVEWWIEAKPIQGSANPTSDLAFCVQTNGSGGEPIFVINNTGAADGATFYFGRAWGSGVHDIYNSMLFSVNGCDFQFNGTSVMGLAQASRLDVYKPLKIGPSSTDAVSLRNATSGGTVLWITTTSTSSVGGNLVLGGTGTGVGTSGTATFAIENGTAPGSSPVDRFQLYSADWNGAGTATAHLRNEEGHIIKLARAATYKPTNVTTDRIYDASATTLDELADVVGTLIADLQTLGFLG